jgi:hypothetical protein
MTIGKDSAVLALDKKYSIYWLKDFLILTDNYATERVKRKPLDALIDIIYK